jgi:hypothetical protein
MKTCTVHEPPDAPADRIDRAASLVFVRDGFSWTAALFAPFWLLANRLWWPFLAYLVASGLIEAARWAFSLDPGMVTLAVVGLHLLAGWEADALKRWGLERRGWRTLGSVSGRNVEECERRFFDQWLPEQPVIAPASGSLASGASAPGPGRAGQAPARSPSSPGRTPVIGSLLGIRS